MNLYTYCENDSINYSDPTGFSNIVVTVGDTGAGYGHNAGGVFSKSAETYINENTSSKDNIWIIYCGSGYWDNPVIMDRKLRSADGFIYVANNVNGLCNIYNSIATHNGKFDKMIFFGHGDPGLFHAFDEESMRGYDYNPNGEYWTPYWFNKDAKMCIYACNSGVDGAEGNSFAQNISNSTGATVWGFSSELGFIGSDYKMKDKLINYKRPWGEEEASKTMPSVNPKKIYMRPYNGKAPTKFKPIN